jgi:hypothetical protein
MIIAKKKKKKKIGDLEAVVHGAGLDVVDVGGTVDGSGLVHELDRAVDVAREIRDADQPVPI